MTTLRALWPILDDVDQPWPELVAEAAKDLPRVAARAHAEIIGPATFAIAPSSQVPGSGNLTRFTLVAQAPARALPPRVYHRPQEQAS